MYQFLKKAQAPYNPKPEATKYRFMCGSTKLVVTREGNLFYHEHPDGVTKKLIGNYKKLAHELRSRDASWITRDEGRHYPKTEKVFFDRTIAMSLLRQGYSVYCESLDTTIRFSDDYSHLIDLNCSMLPDLPASRFMRAFLEPCNEKTYNAVIVEKKEAEAKIAQQNKEAFEQAERVAEAAEQKAEAANQENARLQAEVIRLKEEVKRNTPTTVKKPKKGFGWWCEKVCLIASGVAVGTLFGLGMSNPRN